MRRAVSHRLSATLILGLALLANSAAAEIYKWVDAQGNVHFGDKPTDPRVAADAKKVDVVESYQPTVRTPEEQQAFDEQQRKTRLRDEMRTRDELKAESEAKARRDEQHKKLCADYNAHIEELETVKIKNGMRYLVYATDKDGKPLSSDQQREKIAQLKEERAKAGCT
jgi:hypothetical protein